MSDTLPNNGSAAANPDLFDRLITRGSLSENQRSQLTRLQSDALLTQAGALRRSGLVAEDELSSALTDLYGIAQVSDDEFEFVDIDIKGISLKFLKASIVCPVAEDESEVHIAFAEPGDDFAHRALSQAFDKRVVARIATPSQIEKMIGRYYESSSSAMSDIVDALD
ncbi:MAG: general secretion pathway protein E, partial [Gammaproteobacteria bacterium]